jgi:hypothetical protein
MTLDVLNSKIILALTSNIATASLTFTYKILYSDGEIPEVSSSNSITVIVFDCKSLLMPTNWVWATSIPGVFT